MSFISDFMESLKKLFSGGSSGEGVGGSRLYVGNLSYRVKEEELRSLFAKYGKIKALHLIRDRLTRRLKGYAFVEMSPEDANKALALSGVDFLGRKLVVSIAKAKHHPGGDANRSNPSNNHNSGGGRNRPNRWQKKRRSGPRAYGSSKEDAPIQRLE